MQVTHSQCKDDDEIQPYNYTSIGTDSISLPRYYFALATISTLLSYTRMLKIVAIRSIFATKNSPKCFFSVIRVSSHKIPTSPECLQRLISQCFWCFDSRYLHTLPRYSLLKVGTYVHIRITSSFNFFKSFTKECSAQYHHMPLLYCITTKPHTQAMLYCLL